MSRVALHRSRPLRVAAAAAALAVLAAACQGSRDNGGSTSTGPAGTGSTPGSTGIVDATGCPGNPTEGVSGTTIKLGTSLPQSGIYSGFSEILAGEKAYFGYLNKELGGVEVAGKKYQIELVAKDDGYDAQRTATNVQQLINDDKVFGLFNVVGTKNNLAVRKLVNDTCVPSLLAATGSPAWGNPAYPWVLGTFLVPYPLEAKAFVDYLKANKPNAKVAILRASDDFGRAYSDTFKSLVKGTRITVTREATYNPEAPSTKSQVTSLASSGADTLLLGATLLACPQALNDVRASNWSPLVYMSGTCTSKTLLNAAGAAAEGVISVAPLLDPANPANASVAAMRLYKQKAPLYGAASDQLDNGIVAYGWSAAAMVAEILRRSPKLDRVTVMNTARTLSGVSGIGLMPDGATFNVSADDRFLGETFNLVRYSASNGYSTVLGGLIDEDGKTAGYTPAALING